MKVPGVFTYRTVGDLAAYLRQMVEAIRTGWNVQHQPDGTHGDITAETVTAETVTHSGVPAFDGATQTTVGAAGGASALPATPTGYLEVTIDGTERVIPFYAKS